MKIIKKTLIVITIVFFISLGMGAIQAQDNNDTICIGNVPDDDSELNTPIIDDESVQAASGNDINDNDNASKSFIELQNLIYNVEPNEIVYLNGSYKYNPVEDSNAPNVWISQDITLIGQNNCSIDGSGITRALYINSGCNVVLENITFKNCYCSDNSMGGAIFLSRDSNLTINNCTFHDNTAFNSNGAAIYGWEGTNIEITNSRFYNGKSIRESSDAWGSSKCGMGSAIHVSIGSTLKLIDSVFNNNDAYLSTILVVSYLDSDSLQTSSLYVNNCTFENNTSIGGGVIYLDEFGEGSILNSTFRNNKVSESGANLVLDSSLNTLVKNCLFEKNTGVIGGAIQIKADDGVTVSKVSIVNCSFSKNNAPRGGAIFSNIGDLEVINSTFTENTAETNGGAIYSLSTTLKLTDSIFNKNSAERGGAVYITSEEGTDIYKTSFNSNSASISGGAIYSKNEKVSSSNCNFIGNSAPNALNVYGVYYAQLTQVNSYYGSVELKIKLSSPWEALVSQSFDLKLKGSHNYRFNGYKADSNGVVSIKVPKAVELGKYSVIIGMNGDFLSNPTINVVQAPAKVEIKSITTSFKSNVLLNAHVKNTKTNSLIKGAKINLKVFTGKKYKVYTLTSDNNGLIQFDTSKLAVGNHKVEITSANNNVKISKSTIGIKIKKATAKMIYPKIAKKSSKFKVTIKDKISGKAISKTKFIVKFDSKKQFKAKTDSKGVIKLSTKGLSKGKHKVSIVLKNKNYNIIKKFSIKIK